MGAVIALLLSAAVAQEPGSAPAEDTRAIELYENGAVLFEEGAYEDAVRAWEEAYRLSERPLLLYNLASAYERLGALDKALDRLNTYRAYAPTEEREALERRIRNLERRVAKTTTEDPPPVEPVPAPAPVPESVITVSESVPKRVLGPPSAGAIVGWSAGGAGLGAAAIFGTVALSSRRQLTELCVDGLCQEEATALLDRDRTMSALTDVGLAVGIVGAGVGTALFLTGRSANERTLSVRPVMGLGPQAHVDTLGLRLVVR